MAARSGASSTVGRIWHGAMQACAQRSKLGLMLGFQYPTRLKPPQSGSWHFCANTPLAKSATRYTWLLAWLRPTLSQ